MLRLAGALFLVATAAFSVGDELSSPPAANSLIVVDALAVPGIGLILWRPLAPAGPMHGPAYLALRALEFLAVLGYAAWRDRWLDLVLLTTALAGLVLSDALLRGRLAPRWLGWLGVVGFAALFIGVVAAAAGLWSLTSPTAMAAMAVGAVFEIVFPLWLIVRGRLLDPAERVAGAGHRPAVSLG
ncbi:MAG: DUF4386 domain-containing protein [Micrococcales bacterium]|nr:DUF4386 domain-containing protein [Micrococcales bacterium]